MRKKTGIASRCALASLGAVAVLTIGEGAKAEDLKSIQSQIEAMQAQIKALQKQVQEAQSQAAAAKSANVSGPKSDPDLKVKWKGAPELSSGDGKFKMKVRGRIEADYNKIDQDTRITSFPDVSATEA
jgi:phosphate-selective porin OprO/OprP